MSKEYSNPVLWGVSAAKLSVDLVGDLSACGHAQAGSPTVAVCSLTT